MAAQRCDKLIDGRCGPLALGYFCPVRTADNSVASVLEQYREQLSGLYGPGEIRAIVRSVFEDRLGWDAATVELARTAALSESELLKVYMPLKRIRTGEPLQYVLGHVAFHGIVLNVAPGVLIPRPETEELVDLIIRSGVSPTVVADLGTGSGCIALALKKHFPDASLHGMDVSQEALRIARTNSVRLELDVQWSLADLAAPDFALPQGVDLVVSNPPYIPRSERASLQDQVVVHEPHLALFVEDDDPLFFYRVIATHAVEQLPSHGPL